MYPFLSNQPGKDGTCILHIVVSSELSAKSCRYNVFLLLLFISIIFANKIYQALAIVPGTVLCSVEAIIVPF